ncbi:MAG: Hsp70 family protein [Pseudonocardiaceae bacterium]
MSDGQHSTVIGFDLGHGETAVASLWLNSDDAPRAVDLNEGKGGPRSIITAVSVREEGVVVKIGEPAVRAPNARPYLAFKSPELDGPEIRYPITVFVGEVVRRVLGQRQFTTGSTTWFFGVPSGWTKQQRNDYAALLSEAVAGEVKVVSESRAALLHSRESGDLAVHERSLTDDNIDTGVLIVDIGSSTTDYTWVHKLHAQPMDDGHPRLGAALIDREIMRRVVAAHPEPVLLAEALKQPVNRATLELTCRKAKEAFFSTEVSPDDDELNRRSFGSEELRTPSGEKVDVYIKLSPRDMHDIVNAAQDDLGGLSWQQAFRDDLTAVVEELNALPSLLLMTGGASRMWFAQQICRDLVGPDRVMMGQEPELTIAKGLALAGRTSHRVDRFRAEVHDFIGSGAVHVIVGQHFPVLAINLGKEFAKGKMAKHVIPAFLEWREGKIRTLNDVTARVTTSVQRELKDDQGAWITPVVAQWQNDIATLLAEQTRPICTRARIPAEALTLPHVRVSDTQVVPTVNMAPALEVFNQIGNVLASIFAGVVSASAVAIMSIFAVGGPFTLLLISIGGIIFAFMGKEAAMDKMLSIEIYPWMRKVRSADSLREKLTNQTVDFESKLANAFTVEFTKQSGVRLDSDISTAVEGQLRVRADRAELLIF